uniref:Uncharacterized protein n=1 Tax=Sarcophilus harrisii TaxID=9305 RepID=A0A7N4PIJ5_SARHA
GQEQAAPCQDLPQPPGPLRAPSLPPCPPLPPGAAPGLTGVKDGLQRLDVRGHPRNPVDPDLLNASFLHLLHTLPDDVGHFGALSPVGRGWAAGTQGPLGPTAPTPSPYKGRN